MKTDHNLSFMMIPITASIFLFFAVLLSGCELPSSPFPEYSGKNLLRNTAGEDFSGWNEMPGPQYLSRTLIADTSSSAYDGIPADAAGGVYRLAVPNLFTHGDFAGITTADLAANGFSAGDEGGNTDGIVFEVVNESSLGLKPRIHGDILHISTQDVLDRVDIDLYTALRTPPGELETFSFLFDFWAESDFTWQVRAPLISADTGSTPEKSGKEVVGTYLNFSFPQRDASDNLTGQYAPLLNPEVFSFGLYCFEEPVGQTQQLGVAAGVLLDLYIDNFRILRSDVPLLLGFSLSEGDTELELVSGTYEFSFYVREDVLQADNPAEWGASVFPSEVVSLKIEAEGAVEDLMHEVSFSDVTHNWSDGWVRLSTTFTVQFPEKANRTAGEPLMNFSIAPYSLLNAFSLDTCSVLISSPSLVLLPEGE